MTATENGFDRRGGVSWLVTVSVGPVGDNWGDSRSQRGSKFTRKVRICGAFSAEGSFFSRR